jgi:hypothetical protein
VLSARATILPEKVFFSQSLSKLDQKSGDGSIKSYAFSFDKSDLSGNYLYYEFNSQGICTSPGASFIVGTGARGNGDPPRVTGEGKRDFAGFVVWRNGHTSLFRDSKQMDLPDQITTF